MAPRAELVSERSAQSSWWSSLFGRSPSPRGSPRVYRSPLEKRYNIVRRIGQGATATVELATDRETGEQVVLKIMNRKEGPLGLHMRREVAVQRAVHDHPGFVRLLNVVKSFDSCVLVEEYLSGGDLLDLLPPGQGMPENSLLPYAHQVASALVHMHRKGIVHRDIKCEHIVLDANRQQAKVIDFGYSAYVSEPNLPRRVGTEPYMAPELVGQRESWASSQPPHHTVPQRNTNTHCPCEQVPGSVPDLCEPAKHVQHPVSAAACQCERDDDVPRSASPPVLIASSGSEEIDLFKCDVFSLGVVLLVCVTGFFHWRSPSVLLACGGFEQLVEVLDASESERYQHLSSELRHIISSMLCVDPQRRWSMAEAEEALGKLCERHESAKQ
eukprot:comp21809_c0_seq1/m.31051 comp21809_c0_seq1/g.31051  ORF comp21809_c0_seq1/g.31051 comp21809_c0_seq1/m.31051 type:complete len:385 (-) comp21809_c0_seq1:557-1711(-)